MNIISTCPLCEERSLHIVGEKELTIQQCIWCGYVTSEKYKGTKKDNKEYKKLSDEMKNWSKESNGKIWIPAIFTLPDGLVYPSNVKNTIKWNLAEMVNIPEKEQKNYPIENKDGEYHTRMYDTDNPVIYDNFYEAMNEINNRAKKKGTKEVKLELPKLNHDTE